MNIEVDREGFLRVLGRVQGVVDRRQPMAVLTNVLLDAGARDLSVTATDLEVSLQQSCEASVGKSGRSAVSARKLFEIVRESSSDVIALKGLDNHWLEISYGRSNFKLLGIDPDDHPGMPAASTGAASPSIETSAEDLAEMIRKTVFAVSTDDTRSNLAGVYVERTEEAGILRMVATDGHRLAVIERPVSGGRLENGVILPRKGLAELAKLLADHTGAVSLSMQGNEAVVNVGDALLSMRLVEGSFPDYRQVIPKEMPKMVVATRDELLQSLRRVSILSSERARGVRFTLRPGLVRVSANNPDIGEASEEFAADYDGAELEVGFNARYVTDVLAVLPEGSRVEIGFSDQLSPGVIQGEDSGYRYVVMPMRI